MLATADLLTGAPGLDNIYREPIGPLWSVKFLRCATPGPVLCWLGWSVDDALKALIETRNTRPERVFLVGAEIKSRNGAPTGESLAELGELATSAGGEVIGDGLQKIEAPTPATFIGRGKAAEFAGICRRQDVDTVIFDDELSPAQSRNLEKIFNCKILDRTSLILDIFAQRARTREGKLQIELAQLQHLLPRLTRFWGHLSRQAGGIGMRGGEGESQLETDRRRVQDRIARISRELELVRQQRGIQRQARQRNNWPLASIVGYTNAGKSTLLNALTGAGVLTKDVLFATLDPTTRRLRLPTNQNVLLTDTVGFIRKLPHGLVEAFKATLEEVVQADLLLHVVDVSHPQVEEHIAAVNAVLNEIGAGGHPTVMVFNKLDKLDGNGALTRLHEKFPNAVGISATTGEGIANLLAEIGTQLRPKREFLELRVPHERAQVIARLHQVGQVIERHYHGRMARFKARIPPHFHDEFAPYICAKAE
ncbi:MAG: GTPase HflX [Verrucomicrobiota bacterium]|nr:GTPase HflX [Verrucomicrobiota bacterium]